MTDLIGDYIAWLRDCGKSPRTIGARKDVLGRIDRDLPYGIIQATTDELRAWIFRDTYSAQTKATYCGAVRSCFTWATGGGRAEMAIIDYNPAELLPPPKVPQRLPRPITTEQLQRILTESAEPWRLWSLLAAYAGLRC